MSKVNLLGLTAAQLGDFFAAMGERRFRAVQVLKWIHQRGATDVLAMTDLGRALRDKLAALAEIRPPEVVSQQDSADGTCKWLIRVDGGDCVETVYIPERGRGTLCVSSQIGCVLDCSFCATGKQGFNRDLTAAEIVGQLWIAKRAFGSFAGQEGRRVTNVVMMGMGEPLLNFDNVVAAMNLMMDDNAHGLSKRRVTLSTAGVVPMLERLGEVSDVSLAISLHAPNDALRNELVPLNRKYPIAELLAAARGYLRKLPDSRRRITIEYTLIDGVNDAPEQARELGRLLRDTPCKINLIPFNPFPGSDYRPVRGATVARFQEILAAQGYTVTVRTTRGDDIAAACGQLAGAVNDRTRRSDRHRRRLVRHNEAEEQIVRVIGG